MKAVEAKELYVEACRTKRRTPETGEAHQWAKQFEMNEAQDVRAALDLWWTDSTPTGNGQPRGSFMPQPVELKALVDFSYRKRISRASEAQVLARFQCEECNVTRAGYIQPTDFERRFCRSIPRRPHVAGEHCGGPMIEIHRSDAR